MFSIILNCRLTKWSESNHKFDDSQFGFRFDHSTIDAIFILQSLISRSLDDRKKLFCAFIDLKKAFDLVDRDLLLTKLFVFGVSNKMVKIIQSMYKTANNIVRFRGMLSEKFATYSGVKQGEPLSPLLFLIFINDLHDFLTSSSVSVGLVNLGNLFIFLLLFADDTALFALTADGLQVLLERFNFVL